MPSTATKAARMTKRDMEKFRRPLEEKKVMLSAEIAKTRSAGEETTEEATQDIADKAVSSYTREFLYSLTDGERSTLLQIDDAIARIDDVTYGNCIHCGSLLAWPDSSVGSLVKIDDGGGCCTFHSSSRYKALIWRINRSARLGSSVLFSAAWKYGLRIFPVMPRSPTIRSMMFSSSGERPSPVVDKSRIRLSACSTSPHFAREMWVSTLLMCGWARKAAKIRNAS